MNIGIDVSRANKKVKTGTEWYSYNLILELLKIDSRNRYFLYSPEKLKGKLNNLPANFKEKILKWPPKYLWTMIRLSYEMKFNSPDLLFVPAHIIPLISPKNTITTIHDVGFRRFPELYSKFEIKYHNFGLNQALKKASIIITISEFSKKEIIKFCKVEAEKIKVVYQGFDQDRYKIINSRSEINKIKSKYSLPDKYLLFVGRLNLKKNITNLIKAFKKISNTPELKNYKLVLVGQPETGYNEIQKEIRRQDINNRIIELGWVETKDMPYIMNGAEVFVFPSKYEGFGIPLLEAMSCNIPVVASNYASIPEVVGEAALLFNPNSTNDMANKMFQIIKNNNLRCKLIKLGQERKNKFKWSVSAQEILNIFNSLL